MKRVGWIHASVLFPLLLVGCMEDLVLGVNDEDAEVEDASPGIDGSRPDARPGVDGSSPGVDGSSPDTGRDSALPDGGQVDSATDAPVDARVDADAAPPCGVGEPVMCRTGDICRTSDDCEGLCVANRCAAPTHTDGKRSPSLGETDVDCGGPDAAADPALRCNEARACLVGTDCRSTSCSPKSRTCAGGTSCSIAAADPVSGIETCGVGETTGVNAHESCCRTLPLPVTTTRHLDKYELTAGRMRRFISAVTAQYAGVTNVRRWVYDYAAANPGSQLAYLVTNFPEVVNILPNSAANSAKPPLAVHLGAFPVDPMNRLDGCYVGTGGYGHATYHQATNVLSGYGIPARRFTQAQLDEKPMNCLMPLLGMAFCAWDGGELATAADYREVWGRRPLTIRNAVTPPTSTTTVYLPWTALLPLGSFAWRNGQHTTFQCPIGWTGCVPFSPNPADPTQHNPAMPAQAIFYRYPAGTPLANDLTPLISAPGRFPLDSTAITSANGEAWMDIAGLNLEVGWVPNPPTNPSGAIRDICDVSSAPAAGETPCVRQGQNGVLRYSGALPHLPLLGYSWEGHARYNEAWLANNTPTLGSYKPVTFQYGKVNVRCARTY